MSKTHEQWADIFAHETLHSWMLKGYPNLHAEIKDALLFAMAQAVEEFREKAAQNCEAAAEHHQKLGMVQAVVAEQNRAEDIRALPNPYQSKDAQ